MWISYCNITFSYFSCYHKSSVFREGMNIWETILDCNLWNVYASACTAFKWLRTSFMLHKQKDTRRIAFFNFHFEHSFKLISVDSFELWSNAKSIFLIQSMIFDSDWLISIKKDLYDVIAPNEERGVLNKKTFYREKFFKQIIQQQQDEPDWWNTPIVVVGLLSTLLLQVMFEQHQIFKLKYWKRESYLLLLPIVSQQPIGLHIDNIPHWATTILQHCWKTIYTSGTPAFHKVPVQN